MRRPEASSPICEARRAGRSSVATATTRNRCRMTDLASIWEPVWLTLALAGVTTVVLLLLGTPLAWWLAHTRARIKPVIEALTALPLVLPPTVLGFYLLILLSPTAPIGG